jgi:DDE superfamily endonuclease
MGELLPSKIPIYTDTGFEGINKITQNKIIRKPKKKPRGRKLNGGEKSGNRIISRERVKVEHAIGGMKRFKIISSVYRGISKNMDFAVELCAGLWNFRIQKNLEMTSK